MDKKTWALLRDAMVQILENQQVILTQIGPSLDYNKHMIEDTSELVDQLEDSNV